MNLSSLIPCVFLLQAGTGEAPRPSKPVVLKAARLFDGRSDALIRGGIVVVEGKSIKAVGRGLAVPDGATVIDLGDATLCPGFIDAHTHLTHERSSDYNPGFVDGMRREVSE
jgi:imidazolonepropionase-like amidohydrolase